MGWSRDIGVVAADDVKAAVAQVTANALGKLSSTEEGQKAALVARLTTGGELSRSELDELARLNAAGALKMSSAEADTVDTAAALAVAGVEIMGGHAHVVLGGSSVIDEQPESGMKGKRQTSITVTITVTT